MFMTVPLSPRRALLAYGLGLSFFCYAFVLRVLPSVMTAELARDLAAGGAALGLLSGAYFYAYASMQIPVGLLVDRYGPRRLLSLAMLVCACGSAWMASSDTLHSALLARGLIGAAVAFGFVGTLAIIARYFPPRRFALLAGLVQSAGMLGAVLGQAPLRLLVEHMAWRGTLWALAAVAALLAAVLWLYLPAQAVKTTTLEHKNSALSSLKDVLAIRDNWLAAGLGFGLAASMLAFAGLWAVPWLEQVYALSTAKAASIASLTFIGNAVGSPLAGWWSDRMGRRKPVLLLGAVAGLVGTSATVYGSQWSVLSLQVLFFVSGFAAAVIPTAFAAVRELNEPRVAGTTLGLVNMFVVGSAAVLQPLVGILLDNSTESTAVTATYSAANYHWALSTVVLANALALLCALLIKESNCQNATKSL